MNAMLDIFGAPSLSDLASRPDFLSSQEEAELITRIEDAELPPFRFRQWTGKRLRQSSGHNGDHDVGLAVRVCTKATFVAEHAPPDNGAADHKLGMDWSPKNLANLPE